MHQTILEETETKEQRKIKKGKKVIVLLAWKSNKFQIKRVWQIVIMWFIRNLNMEARKGTEMHRNKIIHQTIDKVQLAQ